jgi:hypothetical protein
MATPSHHYMLLKGGTDNGNSIIYTADDSATQNLIKIGDTLKISGTVSNNSVFTVTDITTDGTALGSTGDVYYSLKGATIANENSGGAPVIEVVRAPGDKMLALGDVDDAGSIDVWSNNATTTYAGTSPGTVGTGWTTTAITPTLAGDNAKYIYYFADEALRVCNINEQNTSIIKWYGYIQRRQFSNTNALVFAGWQENPNNLAPPKLATSFTYAYVNSPAVNTSSTGTNDTLTTSEHDGTQATNYYSENRGVARVKVDSVNDLRFKAHTGHLASMLSAANKTFFDDAINDNDSLFDFGGTNGDGTATLIDSDGFVAEDATFNISSGVGILTNNTTEKATVSLRLITVVGEKYQVNFDTLVAGTCDVSMSLSTDTTFNAGAASASVTHGGATNNALANSFTATAISSYLVIRNDSTTNTHHSDLDNITVRRIDEIVFENTDGTNILDQCTVGEVITIGEALGTYPKEALFCKKVSGGSGGAIKYQRAYGGALIGTAPHVCLQGDTPIVERGLGFNIGITDGTDDGTWEEGTYEFYQTFVYDGNQESLPFPMGDGDDATNLDAGTHVSAGQKALQVSVYADVAYNGRISGGRVYTRLKGTDDDLMLLVDIDIVKGIRTTIDGDHVSWNYQSGKGYYVIGDATGNSVEPNLDTYNTINGFSPEVHFNAIGSRNEIYKSAIVANRRAFVASVKTKGSSGELEKFGDRIMYSEIGKFDTFLAHNFIDVSKGDYGEYTALESFADRLLAFKHNLVHVINIASPSVANWYLEDTVKYFGVNHPFSVARTKYGIAWVSDDGCYLYDGRNVRNLIDKKIAVSEASFTATDVNWQGWYRGTAFVKDIMLGYDAISNSLIMIRSPDDASNNSNTGWIYDFDSNGWSYHTTIFTDDETYTNFVTDWNNNLTLGYQNNADITFQKFLPVGQAKTDQEFTTKDIDFGAPGITKKIYKVTMTYKSTAEQQTPLYYAIDGTQSFGSFTSDITPQGNTGGAGYLESASSWDVATFTASSPISCQSIQLQINLPTSGTFEVNDMTIEYRTIRNKNVS